MYPVKSRAKYLVGVVLERMLPSVVEEIEAGNNAHRLAWVKKQIINLRVKRAANNKNFEQLQSSFKQYWQGKEGGRFYGGFPKRFDEWFMGDHHIFVEELKKILSDSNKFKALIEIGCGDGQVLNYLSDTLPSIENFVGLDINDEVVAKNQTAYASNTRLAFHSVDAAAWVPENIQAGTVLLTYGGVYEYFSETVLRRIFGKLAREHRPSLVVLTEPVSPNHDMEIDNISRPFGMESSLSHNYRYLLSDSGYQVVFSRELRGDICWNIIIAIAD